MGCRGEALSALEVTVPATMFQGPAVMGSYGVGFQFSSLGELSQRPSDIIYIYKLLECLSNFH
jgi:hypothetical protein